MFKRMIDNVKEFLGDVRTELKKVSFPTKAETIGSTTVVIVFCVLMSIYLSVIDSFLSWLVGKII
ncbi:MAG TPA: preprotein translocase subunit SecE [Nitrospira sp.]|jgi:preprotein translocase subunit SecE|nr:secE [Nitrospira sp.]HET6677339.1 preprotein translocase subunit SecE [Nitrospira sp.]HEU4502812.1 preprotein translocase subunit SecE [Nitrospira sp.]